MLTFYKEYPDFLILPMPLAKIENTTILQPPVAKIEDDIISSKTVVKSKTEIGKWAVSQLENPEVQKNLVKHTGWVQHIARRAM